MAKRMDNLVYDDIKIDIKVWNRVDVIMCYTKIITM